MKFYITLIINSISLTILSAYFLNDLCYKECTGIKISLFFRTNLVHINHGHKNRWKTIKTSHEINKDIYKRNNTSINLLISGAREHIVNNLFDLIIVEGLDLFILFVSLLKESARYYWRVRPVTTSVLHGLALPNAIALSKEKRSSLSESTNWSCIASKVSKQRV